MYLQRQISLRLTADELKAVLVDHLRACGMALPTDVKDVKITDPGHEAWEFCGVIIEWTENAKVTAAPSDDASDTVSTVNQD